MWLASLIYGINGMTSYNIILWLDIIVVYMLYYSNIASIYYLLISCYGSVLIVYSIIMIKPIWLLISMGIKLSFAPFNLVLRPIYHKFTTQGYIIWAIVPKVILVILLIKWPFIFYNEILYIWALASGIIITIWGITMHKINDLLLVSSMINGLYLLFVTDPISSLLIYIIHAIILSYWLNHPVYNMLLNSPLLFIISTIVFGSSIGLPPWPNFILKLLIFDDMHSLLAIIIHLLSILYIRPVIAYTTGSSYYLHYSPMFIPLCSILFLITY